MQPCIKVAPALQPEPKQTLHIRVMSKADAEAASIVNDLDIDVDVNVKSEDVAKFYDWIKKNHKRIAIHIAVVFIYWTICLLFIIFDSYQSSHPGTKIASNINQGGLAFPIFRIIFCNFGVLATLIPGFYFVGWGTKLVYQRFGIWVAIPFSIVWLGVCAFFATWQAWLSFLVTPIWTDNFLNTACQGWNMSIMLAPDSLNLEQSLPFLGIATITLVNGTYALQLEQNAANHNFMYFYTLNTTNAEPPISNITYNTYNMTYTVNNVTAHYTTTPNFAIPSRGMQLVDPSIPFISSGPPSANLILKNGSRVLDTVTTLYSDCTQLKVCAMYDSAGDFEIALGIVMMQQFQYAQTC